jgi:hypothetical protein
MGNSNSLTDIEKEIAWIIIHTQPFEKPVEYLPFEVYHDDFSSEWGPYLEDVIESKQRGEKVYQLPENLDIVTETDQGKQVSGRHFNQVFKKVNQERFIHAIKHLQEILSPQYREITDILLHLSDRFSEGDIIPFVDEMTAKYGLHEGMQKLFRNFLRNVMK